MAWSRRSWATVSFFIIVVFVGLQIARSIWLKSGGPSSETRSTSTRTGDDVGDIHLKGPIDPEGSEQAKRLENFTQPSLKADPEMFGAPKLAPIKPGVGVGSFGHPALGGGNEALGNSLPVPNLVEKMPLEAGGQK